MGTAWRRAMERVPTSVQRCAGEYRPSGRWYGGARRVAADARFDDERPHGASPARACGGPPEHRYGAAGCALAVQAATRFGWRAGAGGGNGDLALGKAAGSPEQDKLLQAAEYAREARHDQDMQRGRHPGTFRLRQSGGV